MAIATVIAAVGVAASVAGTAVAYRGQRQAASEQRKMIAAQTAAQQRVEDSRQQQANLDATRRKREIIRQAQIARATALTTASSQGAGDGSVLGGAYGGISGQSGVNMLGVSQNQEIGNDIFAANRSYSQATASGNMAMARAGTTASLGSGMSSLGGALMSNSETIGRIFG